MATEDAMAGESGFAIRCPHCFEWSEWQWDPDTIAIKNEAEFRTFLKGLVDDPKVVDARILRCKQPPWICPAPFEAFVCRSEHEALKYLEVSEAWTVRRDFRLYKLDRISRWEGKYYGIMFCTQGVARHRHIELDHLLPSELLSRTLVGMAEELAAPVSVYVAKGNRPGITGPLWLPIEGFTRGKQYVPPRYNPFCQLCRTASIEALLRKYEGDVDRDHCPLHLAEKGRCAGDVFACMSRDWNRCPSFLSSRKDLGLCYASDLRLISQLANEWCSSNYQEKPHNHTCWAGMREVAFPMGIHDVLVGVVMTGQFVIEPELLISTDAVIARIPSLACHRGQLERLLRVFRGATPTQADEIAASRFIVSESDIRDRISMLQENMVRLVSTATYRYRDFRARSESLFKREIVGHLAEQSTASFWQEDVLRLLDRLRSFWAFEGVCLIRGVRDNGEVYLHAASTESMRKSFGTQGEYVGEVEPEHRQNHPVPVLIDREAMGKVANAYMLDVWRLLEEYSHESKLSAPRGRFYFAVMVPSTDTVSILLYAVRDSNQISPLPARVPGSISDICQEAIFDTSLEVLNRLSIFGF